MRAEMMDEDEQKAFDEALYHANLEIGGYSDFFEVAWMAGREYARQQWEARYAELINLMREGDEAVGICEGIGVDRFLELEGPPGLAQRWRDLIESAASPTTTR